MIDCVSNNNNHLTTENPSIDNNSLETNTRRKEAKENTSFNFCDEYNICNEYKINSKNIEIEFDGINISNPKITIKEPTTVNPNYVGNNTSDTPISIN